MTIPNDSTASVCKTCGATLSSDAAGELCLRCALGNALEPEAVSGGKWQATGGASQPASIQHPVPSIGHPAPRFADYELLEEIARGGMGVVYRARQVSLGRIVAVKMILFGPLASTEQVRRFRAEASAAGCLQHPNIVAIHEVGLHEKQHYLAMDYVDGPNLGRLVHEGPLSVKRAAGYVKVIAEAVHYAHERGILHRDLKPSNVLIDSDDRPRVVDFGLAKRFTGDSSLTLSGQVLGSPSYMPPEQAGAGQVKVGRYSDVYSLGAILYHLLTGRPPFQAETVGQTLNLVANTEALSPRMLNPGVARDLETICLKCLEKEPRKRYPSAQALAEELERYVCDEPIQARPVSQLERAWRWCRRKPVIATLSATTALLLLAVTIGSPIAAFRISRERNIAVNEGARAERNLYVADMNLAAQAWEAGNLSRATELLSQHWPGTSGLSSRDAQPSTDLASFEWRLLWGLAHEDHSKFSFGTGTNRVSCVAVSPDGKHLAYGSAAGAIRITDVAAQRELTALSGHADGVSSLVFSADGRSLASGGGDGTIRLWESGSWREVRGFTGHSNAVSYLAFHPIGTKLISSGDDALRVWELGTGEGVEVIRRPNAGNTISADGTLLASYGGLNNTVRFWKLGDRNEQLPSLPPQKAIIFSVAFFPDGESAVVAADDSSVTRWDLASMKPTQRYQQKAMVRRIALSANGKTLATASTDRPIKLWDAESGQELRTLRGHTNSPTKLALSADGGTLVSASAENTIKVWDSRAGHETNVLAHQGYLLDLAVSRDGKVLATSDPNFHTISLWEVPSQRLVYSDTDPEHKARAHVALSPDGKWLAVGWFFNRGVLELWDISTKPYQKGPTLAVKPSFGVSLKFSPDGRVLSFRGTNGMINLWDVAGQKVFGALANHDGSCATAFTADGKIIATSSDREIRLWDVTSQRRLGSFNAPRGNVWSLSFSPDGRLLAAGGNDRDVNVWDVTDRAHPRLLPPLVGHTAAARAVAFSPDGRTLASGSFDCTVKLWSVALWQEIATLREHSSVVSCLVFSSDGNTLFTGSGDATVRIWTAPTFEEIDRAQKAQPHRSRR